MQIVNVCTGAADMGNTKSQTEDCKCVDLPNGERICDPIDCELCSQMMTVK